jgi:hypothetical protein
MDIHELARRAVPTPWKADDLVIKADSSRAKELAFAVVTGDGIDRDCARATVDLIVHAVNNYEKLVTALEVVQDLSGGVIGQLAKNTLESIKSDKPAEESATPFDALPVETLEFLKECTKDKELWHQQVKTVHAEIRMALAKKSSGE